MFILKHQYCISRVWDKVWKIFVLIWNSELLKNTYRDGSRTTATYEMLLSGTLVKRLKDFRAPESQTQMLQGSIMGLRSLKIISYNLIVLTHHALARSTIPVFYNIYKCLQIIRRFYVKRERIPNFRPVVSGFGIWKTTACDCRTPCHEIQRLWTCTPPTK